MGLSSELDPIQRGLLEINSQLEKGGLSPLSLEKMITDLSLPQPSSKARGYLEKNFPENLPLRWLAGHLLILSPPEAINPDQKPFFVKPAPEATVFLIDFTNICRGQPRKISLSNLAIQEGKNVVSAWIQVWEGAEMVQDFPIPFVLGFGPEQEFPLLVVIGQDKAGSQHLKVASLNLPRGLLDKVFDPATGRLKSLPPPALVKPAPPPKEAPQILETLSPRQQVISLVRAWLASSEVGGSLRLFNQHPEDFIYQPPTTEEKLKALLICGRSFVRQGRTLKLESKGKQGTFLNLKEIIFAGPESFPLPQELTLGPQADGQEGVLVISVDYSKYRLPPRPSLPGIWAPAAIRVGVILFPSSDWQSAFGPDGRFLETKKPSEPPITPMATTERPRKTSLHHQQEPGERVDLRPGQGINAAPFGPSKN